MYLFGDKGARGTVLLNHVKARGTVLIFSIFFPNFLLKVIRNGHIIIGGFYHA